MTQSYTKEYRLIHKKDFKNIFKGSRKFKFPSMTIFVKDNDLFKSRLGISISKKICKSHMRNRFKRCLRESFRKSNYKNLGHDILVIVRKKDFIVDDLFQRLSGE